ncbi:unnamed protein product [Staurois parvus]|uniref:ATP synthase F0 subunit 8 n=1 Tax=Staurois parvus TaxID=386267 RepID=A0ABN9FLZ8_9NEOB|nr:unnamed protein product [Staurois parvus]
MKKKKYIYIYIFFFLFFFFCFLRFFSYFTITKVIYEERLYICNTKTLFSKCLDFQW